MQRKPVNVSTEWMVCDERQRRRSLECLRDVSLSTREKREDERTRKRKRERKKQTTENPIRAQAHSRRASSVDNLSQTDFHPPLVKANEITRIYDGIRIFFLFFAH